VSFEQFIFGLSGLVLLVLSCICRAPASALPPHAVSGVPERSQPKLRYATFSREEINHHANNGGSVGFPLGASASIACVVTGIGVLAVTIAWA